MICGVDCKTFFLFTAVMGFLVKCSLEVKAKSNNCWTIITMTSKMKKRETKKVVFGPTKEISTLKYVLLILLLGAYHQL